MSTLSSFRYSVITANEVGKVIVFLHSCISKFDTPVH
jgi:hypothetical protein